MEWKNYFVLCFNKRCIYKKKIKLQPLGHRVIAERLEEKQTLKGGIILPESAKKKQETMRVVAVGKGKLGKDLTIDQGREAARITGINMIANLKNAIGDLNKVKRIVKVLGMVNSAENFTDQPKVINGFSDLMVAVFGEKGKHARSAVGMMALPMNMAVEIEMIVELK